MLTFCKARTADRVLNVYQKILNCSSEAESRGVGLVNGKTGENQMSYYL